MSVCLHCVPKKLDHQTHGGNFARSTLIEGFLVHNGLDPTQSIEVRIFPEPGRRDLTNG